MRLSGFSFARNAVSLDYPIVESIKSVLPIVDEFIIALGDSSDNTTDVVRSIGDKKIKIIETVWNPGLFVHGAINAEQTNIALSQCKGDWCIYLQADEVIHEKYLPVIVEACKKYLHNKGVEGFLLSYKHFWGDYFKYQKAHNWYRREIRVVRNGIGVHSWKSAQSFRIHGRKMHTILIPAEVYHYGWVREPVTMKRKSVALDSLHHSKEYIEEKYPGKQKATPFEYGSLKYLADFKGTHPAVMKDRIAAKNWTVTENPKVKHKHMKFSIRLLSAIENLLGTRLGEYRNYHLIGKDYSLKRFIGEEI